MPLVLDFTFYSISLRYLGVPREQHAGNTAGLSRACQPS
jgi:hypothetical protein